jgi:hypothetical protein
LRGATSSLSDGRAIFDLYRCTNHSVKSTNICRPAVRFTDTSPARLATASGKSVGQFAIILCEAFRRRTSWVRHIVVWLIKYECFAGARLMAPRRFPFPPRDYAPNEAG